MCLVTVNKISLVHIHIEFLIDNIYFPKLKLNADHLVMAN